MRNSNNNNFFQDVWAFNPFYVNIYFQFSFALSEKVREFDIGVFDQTDPDIEKSVVSFYAVKNLEKTQSLLDVQNFVDEIDVETSVYKFIEKISNKIGEKFPSELLVRVSLLK